MKFSNTIKTVLKIYQKYVKNSVWFGTGARGLLMKWTSFQVVFNDLKNHFYMASYFLNLFQ